MSFIKPLTPFHEGKWEGSAEFVSATDREIIVQSNGEQFTLRRWNWENAYEKNAWIKLGKRCTLWTEEEMRQETNQTSVCVIDTRQIQTTLLGQIPVNAELYKPIKTGTFIDQFWSRKSGIPKGTVTMITGDPGIGKSSVMMDLLQGVKKVNPKSKVLYVSAEMTLVDMLDPDEFMKYYPGLMDKVEFLFAGDFIDNETGPTFSQALEVILNRGYDIVVFDSMIETQSICQAEMSLGSGKSAEKFMLNLMQKHVQAQNETQKHTTFLLIQQVKKDGEFVGSRRLEHMITSFLSIKWDVETRGKKYLEFRKNRRGDVKRRLYFKFGQEGIVYDEEKFADEVKLGEILSDNKHIVDELSELELTALLTGKEL